MDSENRASIAGAPVQTGPHEHGGADADSEQAGYELRDANPRAILGFLAALFLALLVISGLMWGWFHYLQATVKLPAPTSPFSNVRQIPPGPQLQVNAREDLRKSNAQQQQELENYAWDNRQAGTVRVPIERAMELLLQRGLPVLPMAGAATGAASAPGAADAASADTPRGQSQSGRSAASARPKGN